MSVSPPMPDLPGTRPGLDPGHLPLRSAGQLAERAEAGRPRASAP